METWTESKNRVRPVRNRRGFGAKKEKKRDGRKERKVGVCCGFDVSLGEEAEQFEVQLGPLEGSIFKYVF